jgi:hypothetical protein
MKVFSFLPAGQRLSEKSFKTCEVEYSFRWKIQINGFKNSFECCQGKERSCFQCWFHLERLLLKLLDEASEYSVEWDEKEIVYSEMNRLWEEAVGACSKVLSRHSSERTEKTHENPVDTWWPSRYFNRVPTEYKLYLGSRLSKVLQFEGEIPQHDIKLDVSGHNCPPPPPEDTHTHTHINTEIRRPWLSVLIQLLLEWHRTWYVHRSFSQCAKT